MGRQTPLGSRLGLGHIIPFRSETIQNRLTQNMRNCTRGRVSVERVNDTVREQIPN